MRVRVRVWQDDIAMSNYYRFDDGAQEDEPIIDYVMDYNDDLQRKRLATSCRDAFEAGQVVLTMPVD